MEPIESRNSPPAQTSIVFGNPGIGKCYDLLMPCDPLRDLRAWQERLERLAVQHGTAWAPPIDVYETEDRYVVTAEVPGLTREGIELAVQDNRLLIRGTRSAGGPENG